MWNVLKTFIAIKSCYKLLRKDFEGLNKLDILLHSSILAIKPLMKVKLKKLLGRLMYFLKNFVDDLDCKDDKSTNKLVQDNQVQMNKIRYFLRLSKYAF